MSELNFVWLAACSSLGVVPFGGLFLKIWKKKRTNERIF
jgi:hypothetical protein